MSTSSDDDTIDLGVLNDYVEQALPSLSVSARSDVIDKLLRLGVETPSDLRFLDEDDLKSLKKIHVRKLLQASTKEKAALHEKPTLHAHHASPCSSSFSESSPDIGSLSASSYVIPWDKLPHRLQSSIKKKERPLPADRREMVRILTDDLTRIYSKPTRHQLATVASKIVAEQPASFQDKMDGMVIGSGYGSLLAQMEQRCQNNKRKSSSAKRCLDKSESPTTGESNRSADEYETVELPENENEETQEEKRKSLQEMYTREIWNKEEIKTSMAIIYPSLRKAINSCKESVQDLKDKWPFLFEAEMMLDHANRLVGHNLKNSIVTSLEVKFPRLLQYCSTKPSKNLRGTLQQLDSAKRQQSNNMPEVIGSLIVLLNFFGEDVSTLIQETEDTSLVTDIATEKLAVTPCLVALGSPFTTQNFMLAIDRIIVNNHINSAADAVSLLFSSFFVFNIQYPEKAVATMEFLQRCFAGVNPSTGSKAKKCPRDSVHPKVLSLINNLTDFESQWKI